MAPLRAPSYADMKKHISMAKLLYLTANYRQCKHRCEEVLAVITPQTDPVHKATMLIYAGMSHEAIARGMHQFSVAREPTFAKADEAYTAALTILNASAIPMHTPSQPSYSVTSPASGRNVHFEDTYEDTHSFSLDSTASLSRRSSIYSDDSLPEPLSANSTAPTTPNDSFIEQSPPPNMRSPRSEDYDCTKGIFTSPLRPVSSHDVSLLLGIPKPSPLRVRKTPSNLSLNGGGSVGEPELQTDDEDNMDDNPRISRMLFPKPPSQGKNRISYFGHFSPPRAHASVSCFEEDSNTDADEQEQTLVEQAEEEIMPSSNNTGEREAKGDAEVEEGTECSLSNPNTKLADIQELLKQDDFSDSESVFLALSHASHVRRFNRELEDLKDMTQACVLGLEKARRKPEPPRSRAEKIQECKARGWQRKRYDPARVQRLCRVALAELGEDAR